MDQSVLAIPKRELCNHGAIDGRAFGIVDFEKNVSIGERVPRRREDQSTQMHRLARLVERFVSGDKCSYKLIDYRLVFSFSDECASFAYNF